MVALFNNDSAASELLDEDLELRSRVELWDIKYILNLGSFKKVLLHSLKLKH